MLKMGVSVYDLRDEMRRALNKIEDCYNVEGLEAVITSTTGGVHMPSSLHYVGRAVDVRKPPETKLDRIVRCLRDKLGKNFDVVVEHDHIHIEYDPKRR